jgi:hypothetical protein
MILPARTKQFQLEHAGTADQVFVRYELMLMRSSAWDGVNRTSSSSAKNDIDPSIVALSR